MDDVYIYFVNLPCNVNEMVVPCCDGYTVYIDVKLSYDEKIEAYRHAIEHINNDDFHSDLAVDHIEGKRNSDKPKRGKEGGEG